MIVPIIARVTGAGGIFFTCTANIKIELWEPGKQVKISCEPRGSRDPSPALRWLIVLVFNPSPTRGEGIPRADFPVLMQDSDSPLPLWERDAGTCGEFCSRVGEGSPASHLQEDRLRNRAYEWERRGIWLPRRETQIGKRQTILRLTALGPF